MNPTRRLAFGFALTLALTLAPGPLAVLAGAASRPIDSLIAAERAFSGWSVAKGIRPAFLAFLAEDAVIFRPGPINGMQSWRDRGEVPGILEWGPEFVELSGAGDLGFSTGPWAYRASADAKEADYGHFITVWRRDAQGEWKVALDCGGSHARPEIELSGVKVTEGPVHAPPDSNAWKRHGFDVGGAVTRSGTTVGAGTGGFGIGRSAGGLGMGLGVFDNGVRSRVDYEYRRTSHEKNTMMTADRALGWNARNKGWDRAYREVAAGDLRCQRRGAAPTLGPDAASAASATRPRDITWDYRGNGVAKSWDIGYVYGLATWRTKGAHAPDTSAFVHLWRKDDAGKWRMVIDWEGPFANR